MSADDCRRHARSMAIWDGVATYLLWDRLTDEPIYCGTARNRSSLLRHLAKDDLVNGPVGKTMVNMGLRNYCLSRPIGWLGMSYKMFPSDDAARAEEQRVIRLYGIKSMGGKLYNQRLSG